MFDRAKCLDIAKKIVESDRQNSYGNPENNFQRIANLWNSYLDDPKIKLNAVDVSAMLALLKIARIKSNPKHADNFIDLAGYAACGFEIVSGRNQWPQPLEENDNE